jgi:hypothetical protein
LSGFKISRDEQLARRNYLNDLRNECNRLPLAALAEDRDPHQGAAMSLSQVYVDLNITTQKLNRRLDKRRKTNLNFEHAEEAEPVTALEVVRKMKD